MNQSQTNIDPDANVVALAKFNKLTEDFLPEDERGAYCAVFTHGDEGGVHVGAKLNVKRAGLVRIIFALTRAAERLATLHKLPIRVRVEHA